MPVNDATQIGTMAKAAVQAYTAQSTGSTQSGSLFSELLGAQMGSSMLAGAQGGTGSESSLLSSMLPMLFMGNMFGAEGGSNSPVMMAMMLALSTERGRQELGLIGNSLTGANAASGALTSGLRSYTRTAPNAAQSTSRASTAAASSAYAATRAVSAADAARFNQAASAISSAGNRSASSYRKVIDQLDVENNPRYAPRNGSTYCNIFQWDVTKAMGAEIPHYTNANTGAPTSKDDPDVRHMNANRISGWLNEHGERYGWYEVSAEQAQRLANQGHPAVTIWKNNSGGHGHCQVVCPSQNGDYDPVRGVTIAQAGRRLMNYNYITNVYSSTLPEVQYFAHK